MNKFSPPCFDLAHYQGMNRWDEGQWLRAVSTRRLLASAAGGIPGMPCEIVGEKIASSWFEDLFQRIQSDPVSPIPFEFAETGRMQVGPSHGIFAPPVQVITNAKEQKSGDGRVFLSVDLAASDAAVTASFQAWLKFQRTQASRVKEISTVDMRNWFDSLALPFIDLKIYCVATGQTMTDEIASELLFEKRPDRGIDSLRKVTKKHARRLLSTQLSRRLSAQLSLKG
ncbi:MAG: hypothetical protein KKC79_02310 [Gammaproteobacteria bacterium]|nr:hypothetical protein [Gammaproteobacteria bacterium]MBU1441450.1 hypothetical protein [Gammaproteobacteria bacterium]MBU2285560.1 hypothetical protein [Gammaproteobacteria bacterium]MBU2407464.1 hypothetical protein [Gammaproteobacteria bacterium]